MTAPAARPASAFLAVAAIALIALLWALREIAMLVAFAVLIAYALDPLVVMLERLRLGRGRRVSRPFAAGVVVVVLVVLMVWVAVLALPRLASELVGFVQRIPDNAEHLLHEVRLWAADRQLSQYVDPAIDSIRQNAAALVQSAGGLVAGWIGRLFGGFVELLGLAVLPVLAFYLLAEREAVQASVLRFVPDEAHARLLAVVAQVNRALRSYVRGQALVCLVVGASVALVLSMLRFPLALLLGVLAGVAEVVPYLGALVTMVAIALTGYGVGPWTALAGVLAYAAVNNAVGLLVTPRVMGRHLMMHPFVVTVSILAGARLLGPAGAILALPGAAVLQALVQTLAPRPPADAGIEPLGADPGADPGGDPAGGDPGPAPRGNQPGAGGR